MSSTRSTTPPRPASRQGPASSSYCSSSAASAISPAWAAVKPRSPRISVIEVDSAPGIPRRAILVTSSSTSSRPRSTSTTRLRACSSPSTGASLPSGLRGWGRFRIAGRFRPGWGATPGRTARLRSRREGMTMSQEPGRDPGPSATASWPCVPVPSVPGDVWHWQLESMPVVSRVRSDLRARIAPPSVSSASTDDARDGLLLVFEELASNALRHGGGDVRALVVAGRDGWLLDLSDEAPDRPPGPAGARDPALGGMGLHLVAQLSIAYGWEGRPGRKHVWARLPSGREEAPEE